MAWEGMRVSNTQTRSALFFGCYLAVLVFSLFWVDFPTVRDAVGRNIHLFHWLVGGSLAYVLMRAYLVMGRGLESAALDTAWITIDVLIITTFVGLTGGVRSEAAVLYLLPILTSAVQRMPSKALVTGLVCAALYFGVVLAVGLAPHEVYWVLTRLFLIVLLTVLATSYSLTEIATVEELSRLREQVALADYRQLLSQEMHDGIKHYLMTLAARLSLAAMLREKEPEQSIKLATDQLPTVRQASDELSYLVRRLRSPVVERRGFAGALRAHIDMLADRAPFAVTLDVEGEAIALAPDIEQAAFRIVQEAITNAEKHAAPESVSVRLRFLPDALTCIVADDGKGFDVAGKTSDIEDPGQIGLDSMAQRAEVVGGKLQLESSPGAGTTVRFTVPLSPQ